VILVEIARQLNGHEGHVPLEVTAAGRLFCGTSLKFLRIDSGEVLCSATGAALRRKPILRLAPIADEGLVIR
jgi:hypothetical protein